VVAPAGEAAEDDEEEDDEENEAHGAHRDTVWRWGSNSVKTQKASPRPTQW
jgi:hypothetical protein